MGWILDMRAAEAHVKNIVGILSTEGLRVLPIVNW